MNSLYIVTVGRIQCLKFNWFLVGAFSLKETRRERLKSAPYLRLKKRKTFFLEKTCTSKKSRIVPKNVKGGNFLDFNIHAVAKYQKLEGGRDPLEKLKNFQKKVAQCRKKIQRGTL